MVYIDAVHYETDSHGCEVISQLKWTNTLTEQATNICTKAQMISFINDNPDCTKTKYNSPIWGWREGEDGQADKEMACRSRERQRRIQDVGQRSRTSVRIFRAFGDSVFR